jgi:hypothetical protein
MNISSFLGLITLLLSFSDSFDLPRVVFGHLFVFIFSGWPVVKLLIPKHHLYEKILLSSLFSILITYPASILIVIIEGQSGQAIFSRHLPLSITVLLTISLLLSFFVKKIVKTYKPILPPSKIYYSGFLIIPIMVFAWFAFKNLNYPDVYGDEYDLGYQAYNLVDGIKAGRKAFLISFSGHPPLTMSLKHYSLNLLEPTGLDYLSDWHFRFSEGILGILTMLATYTLAARLTSSRLALLATILLSVNPYFIWLARIFHREMLLTYLIVLTINYLIASYNQFRHAVLAGISLGAALLTKETALLLLPIMIFYRSKINLRQILIPALVVFMPVVVYNVLAYINTGYADVFFSNLFGTMRPGATPRDDLQLIPKFLAILTYLIDLYGPLIFISFLIAFVATIRYRRLLVLHLCIILGLAFYLLTAVRGYYFIFITIPLIILLIQVLSLIKSRKIKLTIFATLVIYSSIYSYNTHINRHDTVANEPKDIDGNIIVPIKITQTKSNVAIGWAYNHGYKDLLIYLDSSKPNCVITDESLNPLAVRRYLWLNDGIKAHYLINYPNRFPSCKPPADGILISKLNLSNRLVHTIKDNQGTPQFFLYQFPN